MSEQNHPWRKLARTALAAASVAAVAVTTEALAQPFLSCSRESQRLYAACADATERVYQQHRKWVSSRGNYEDGRLNQERQRDLDSCRATAEAYRTNCNN